MQGHLTSGLSIIVLITWWCTSMQSHELLPPFPGALSLLEGGSQLLPSLLKSYDFVYDHDLKRFRCDVIDLAGYSGSMLLTALGKSTSARGRRMSPERLESGEPLKAIQFTLFFDDAPNPPIAGNQASKLFDDLLSMDNIEGSDVIREDVAPSSNDIPPISCLAARCASDNKPAIWAVTISGWVGFTCSCSNLRYYLGNIGADTAGELYEAVPPAAPWDIPIDDVIGENRGGHYEQHEQKR